MPRVGSAFPARCCGQEMGYVCVLGVWVGEQGASLGEEVPAALHLLAPGHLVLKAAAPSPLLTLSVSSPIPCGVGSPSCFTVWKMRAQRSDTPCPKSHCKPEIRPGIFVPASKIPLDFMEGGWDLALTPPSRTPFCSAGFLPASRGRGPGLSTCCRKQPEHILIHIIRGL